MTKKEKLVASAQKSLQDGHLNKALKDYQKLVELDPKDLRNRQKLGELYNRAKMPDLAIEEFRKVGKYYAENGFYLKAIAVYKQIQKINPERPEVYNMLAELNAKQGLVGNALAEYRNLTAHYEQHGNTNKVIETLQKMKDIDPENLNIRVKLSEIYAKNGLREDALADLREIMGILQAKKDPVKIFKLYEMFSELFPEELSLKAGLGVAFIQRGDVEKGISVLREVLRKSPDNWPVLRALAEGHRKLGNHGPEQEIYTRLVSVFPEDLDLRELQVQALMDTGAFETALNALEESKDAFFEDDRVLALKIYYESLRSRLPNENRITTTLRSIDEVSSGSPEFFNTLSGETSLDDSRFPVMEASVSEADAFELEPPDAFDNRLETSNYSECAEDSEEIPLEFLEEVEEVEEVEGDVIAPVREDVELALDYDEVVFSDIDTDMTTEASAEPSDVFNLDEDELSFSLDEEEPFTANYEVVSDVQDFDFGSVDDLIVGINGPPAAAEEPATDFFDFSTEVMAEFNGTADIPAPTPGKKDRFALEGEFSQFKKGVEAQIDANDAESHFNLGIAYKEMGLLNDAIGEFDQVMKNAARRVDGLTLKGICLRELNEYEKAEETFKFGLAIPELGANQRISFFYELGLLYEAWNRVQDALKSFRNVAEVDMSFRNVRDRIQDLGNRNF